MVKKPIPKQLPAENLYYQNMTIISQATRFVCCSNKDYLDVLVKTYTKLGNTRLISIRKALFEKIV